MRHSGPVHVCLSLRSFSSRARASAAGYRRFLCEHHLVGSLLFPRVGLCALPVGLRMAVCMTTSFAPAAVAIDASRARRASPPPTCLDVVNADFDKHSET
jgi:hypothetical protein